MKSRYKKVLRKLVRGGVRVEKFYTSIEEAKYYENNSHISDRILYSIDIWSERLKCATKYYIGRYIINRITGELAEFEWYLGKYRLLFWVLGLKEEGDKKLNEEEI